jgi:hypothetical protein
VCSRHAGNDFAHASDIELQKACDDSGGNLCRVLGEHLFNCLGFGAPVSEAQLGHRSRFSPSSRNQGSITVEAGKRRCEERVCISLRGVCGEIWS